jgi:hypothetical protein
MPVKLETKSIFEGKPLLSNTFRPIGRNAFKQGVKALGKNFAQGAAEDQAKDMMGMPNLQTGKPSLGGMCHPVSQDDSESVC